MVGRLVLASVWLLADSAPEVTSAARSVSDTFPFPFSTPASFSGISCRLLTTRGLFSLADDGMLDNGFVALPSSMSFPESSLSLSILILRFGRRGANEGEVGIASLVDFVISIS
jgi:hypothetical protein